MEIGIFAWMGEREQRSGLRNVAPPKAMSMDAWLTWGRSGLEVPRLATVACNPLVCQQGLLSVDSSSVRSASASCRRLVAQASHEAWEFRRDHRCGFPMSDAG